jgi:hypothetical protein
MQITVFFIAAIVWLALFGAGSILFELTGMERRKARFQTLSANRDRLHHYGGRICRQPS